MDTIGKEIKKIKTFDPYDITYNLECNKPKEIIKNGKIKKISSKKEFIEEFKKSREYAYNKFNNYDAIVELGSGWGRNIFTYLNENDLSNIDIYSGEFTESGLEIQKYLNDNFYKKNNLHIFHFDYNNSNIFFKRINNKKYNKILYLTFWSIEQITYLNDTLFNNIKNSSKNISCIHIEPVGWQINKNSIMEENKIGNKSYYNKNLYSKLLELSKENKISISNIILDLFNTSSYKNSCGTLIEWNKIN